MKPYLYTLLTIWTLSAASSLLALTFSEFPIKSERTRVGATTGILISVFFIVWTLQQIATIK